MNPLQTHSHLLRRSALVIFAVIICLAGAMPSSLRAADVTWNNMSGSSVWNLTDLNWSTGAWNNANGDGAVFGSTGAGTVAVASPINANSIGFTVSGYTLNGPGPINLVSGTSSLGTGYIFSDTGFTNTINSAINTSVGLFKLGGGVAELGGPVAFSGPGISFLQTGALRFDVFAAGLSQVNLGGTIRVLNSSVFAPSTRVGTNNGLIDFGANNQTLAEVVLNNQSDAVAYDPSIRAAGAGLIGTGTLRVTGDINVIGQSAGNNGANTIANNLDLGGGTQIIRTSANGQSLLYGALQLTGTLSNGSLLTTVGTNGTNGFSIAADGISLVGNNTYTGSTTINGGFNIASGTNASPSILISGNNGPPGSGNTLTLHGANGSFLAANTIQLYAGGGLILDNNFASGGISGTAPVAAAQNNNRLSDTAVIQIRDANFTLRGLSTAAASETIGGITLQGGHNIITLAPVGAGGTVTLNVGGDLTMSSRSTLQVASATIGAASKMFVNGALPVADATGILPRIVGTSDFLTYNGATGFTPYTGYAPDFTTPGTNVAVTAAASVPASINVNAIKSTNSATTTIGAGQTLGVTSGMLLNTSGTRTYTGGTIDFGATPGAFFGGNTVNSAITGSNGLLNATGTLTLAGDLSGLSGTITQNGFGSTSLNTNTFAGAIEVRGGFLNVGTSQTLAGQGAITLGVAANDAHLVSNIATLSFSAAGANAVIARDIIVDNGGLDAAGQRLDFATLPATFTPLSNTTGSQTLSGNITLNSPVRLQGGGASATSTGATIFGGNISGSSFMQIINGREVFSGNVSNAGGFYIGRQGNRTEVTFNGTTTGSVPLIISGATFNRVNYAPGSLPTGTITTDIVDSFSVPFLAPLADSTINNTMVLRPVFNTFTGAIFPGAGTIGADVGGGISATWAGPISGVGGLTKTGAGILTLSNAANLYTGTTTINAGTLVAASDGSLGYGNVTLSAAGVVLTLQGGANNNYIADTATLNIGFVSDTVNLNYTGTDTINALIINGVNQATGTWGAPGSGAAHTDPIFTGTGILNVVLAPTITGAVSRKNHGGTDFDLPLPLPPNQMAIEPRLGGATNDYTIIVTFGEAVTVAGKPQAELIAGSGAIGSGGTPNGGMVTVSGNMVNIPLTNVTSQQIIQVRLNGVNGSSNVVIPMGVLVGDVNGNGSVSASDIAQTKTASGQGVNASNFRTDVNVSGDINAADISLVKSRSGTSLP